jgi:hypothetical protein
MQTWSLQQMCAICKHGMYSLLHSDCMTSGIGSHCNIALMVIGRHTCIQECGWCADHRVIWDGSGMSVASIVGTYLQTMPLAAHWLLHKNTAFCTMAMQSTASAGRSMLSTCSKHANSQALNTSTQTALTTKRMSHSRCLSSHYGR